MNHRLIKVKKWKKKELFSLFFSEKSYFMILLLDMELQELAPAVVAGV